MGIFDRWLKPDPDPGPPWRPPEEPEPEAETLDFRPPPLRRVYPPEADTPLEDRLKRSRAEGDVASRPVVRGGLPAGWPAKEYPWCTDPKEGPR